MRIKDIEDQLEIPRATVRFYEKEGLIQPNRSEKGYREYSNEDVVKLQRIIILRKLGISVTDIEAILNGSKQLSEVVAHNIVHLEKEINSLKGALYVCHKLQDHQEEIHTFDVEKYWHVIEEEEIKGNRFIDIAKDVAQFQKATVLEYFGVADVNGNLAVSLPKAVFSVFFVTALCGCLFCIMENKWDIQNFVCGIKSVLTILIIEMVIGLPVYLISKKYPKIRKYKTKILIGVCLALCVMLIVLDYALKG